MRLFPRKSTDATDASAAPVPKKKTGVAKLAFRTVTTVSLTLNVALCTREVGVYAVSPTAQVGMEEIWYTDIAKQMDEWNMTRIRYENEATKWVVRWGLRWVRYAIQENIIPPPPPKPVEPPKPQKPESTWSDPRTWSIFN